MPTFEMDGRHIYFESHGQGRPLVLLNGIMMSCVSWQPFVEALSANNRLILVDFLDQGKSEKMVGQTYDHGIQVQVVRRLLEHLNLQSACVAGISYGSEPASSNPICVYTFIVTDISECPMRYCSVFGFIPDFAIFEQYVCRHT